MVGRADVVEAVLLLAPFTSPSIDRSSPSATPNGASPKSRHSPSRIILPLSYEPVAKLENRHCEYGLGAIFS